MTLMSGYAGSYNSGSNGSVVMSGTPYNTTNGIPSNEMPWINANGLDPDSGGMGDENTSYLYLKLLGTHTTVNGSGSQMPTNGLSISQQDLDALRDWIQVGAPDAHHNLSPLKVCHSWTDGIGI